MCELFGFSGAMPRDLTRELRVFFSHEAQNPNGWGMARLEDGVLRLEVEAKPSHEAPIWLRCWQSRSAATRCWPTSAWPLSAISAQKTAIPSMRRTPPAAAGS